MRINIVAGFFLPIPPVRGGATEKIWHRLSQFLAAAGHSVTLISRQWPGWPDDEVIDGVRYLRVPGMDHTRSLRRNLWRDFRWGLRVGRRLPEADVTLCNTVMLPIWLHRRHPRAGRIVSVMSRMPKGQTRFYRNVDLFLSLSTSVTRALTAENPAIAGRIVPFPYPIDWELHAAAARARSVAQHDVVIGYVGRIHPEKGIGLLLEAAVALAADEQLPRWRLELTGPTAVPAGGGGEEYVQKLLRQYFSSLGERLHFAGPEFDPRPLASRYAAIDVFCYPSIAETGETFGVAVAEAMAARCAPIVSDLPCFTDLIASERTGLVFDHRAPDAARQLAVLLRRLIIDQNLRTTLANAAQHHARAFDFHGVGRALEQNLLNATAAKR